MIFIDACFRKETPYTPVWMMRQAGRYLSEYQESRKKAGSFLELCKNSDLATEVTLQPVEILGVDAAILFSDILVVPLEMGLNLEFVPKKGPHFLETIFMSAGFMAGVRLFKGWVIPKIALGYQLQILGAKIDKYQFNIQSAVGSVGLFFNAAKNFGLSIEARGGIPFYFIQSKFSKAFGTPRLNIYSIGITFTFYDFTRFLG
ncbi:hypothetical protein JP0106_08740 [Helicobacter pylori]|nr:hypothetical protein JP0106_08740 [Helicobacter pylori]